MRAEMNGEEDKDASRMAEAQAFLWHRSPFSVTSAKLLLPGMNGFQGKQ